ncbi:hypothetical protein [Rheinheimera sp.]|uniref:hypothetical protein n=1 Tax=Rheinheimera sp. TaxID=1869214 RepID=UPI0040480AB7
MDDSTARKNDYKDIGKWLAAKETARPSRVGKRDRDKKKNIPRVEREVEFKLKLMENSSLSQSTLDPWIKTKKE